MPDQKDQDEAFDQLERQIADALRHAPVPSPPEFDPSQLQAHARVGRRRRSRYTWIGGALAAGVAGIVLFQMNGVFRFSAPQDVAGGKPVNSSLPSGVDEVRGSHTSHFNWTITDLRLTEPAATNHDQQSPPNHPSQLCRSHTKIVLEGSAAKTYTGDIGVDLTPQEADAGLFVHTEKDLSGGWDVLLAAPCPGPKSIMLQVSLGNWRSDQPLPDQVTKSGEVLRLREPQ